MASDTVIADTDGAVRTLRLNRPNKLNAMNQEATAALLDALRAADSEPEIAVIVLTGAGRAFCAGADISEFKDLSADNPQAAGARADMVLQLHGAFSRLNKPVLGAVNGIAFGGGCGLAMACDFVVAAETAQLGYPEIKLGAVAAIVMASLVRQVGRKTAFELVALGEPITAAQAKQLGMLNRVVPDDHLMSEVNMVANKMAGFSRDAMRATKRLFYRAAELSYLPALEAGRDANMMMRSYQMHSKA